MFFKGNDIASRNGLARLVYQGFRPGHIVGFIEGNLGNAVVDQLTHGFLKRGKVAACDMGLNPSFLFRSQGDCHGSLYQGGWQFQRKKLICHLIMYIDSFVVINYMTGCVTYLGSLDVVRAFVTQTSV